MWKKHICTVEIRLVKQIGVSYYAKPLLQGKSPKSILHIFIDILTKPILHGLIHIEPN